MEQLLSNVKHVAKRGHAKARKTTMLKRSGAMSADSTSHNPFSQINNGIMWERSRENAQLAAKGHSPQANCGSGPAELQDAHSLAT